MALRVRAQGHTFFFSYDEVDPTLLHIYARHLCQPSDAIEVFFTGESEYNSINHRWETYTATHGIYWFWRDEAEKKVWIISCFTLQPR